jgi:hypothetical protein
MIRMLSRPSDPHHRPRRIARDHGRRHGHGLMLLLLLLVVVELRRRHLVPHRPVVSLAGLDKLHEGVLEGALEDAGDTDLARRHAWHVGGRMRRSFSLILVGLATLGLEEGEGWLAWSRDCVTPPAVETYTAVCAGGAVDVDPVRAVVGEEVLASVLVETSAAAHDGWWWDL